MKRWPLYGAIVGLVITILNRMGWWGSPAAPQSTAEAFGNIAGGMVGGALLFLIAAYVANFLIRD